MKHLVIGTAGHVDHGKTALIRALTGQETDRLPEEKERGISIDIGFAQFKLPSGRRAAVIDVPGHERFIKNMLAGITGIDLVLLVVAADEGVMPQTIEHLDILRLLQIRQGLVVLTKKDLVDAELLELVAEDVAAAVEGTFLAAAPVLAVSAVSGEGLPELLAQLDAMLAVTESKDVTAVTRLPIDRAFVRPGFGTVVTGTLVGGVLRLGDRLELLPAGDEVRVRGLQVHGEKVERAEAGQRVAVNLAGIDRADVQRGDVLCQPGALEPTRSFAARLHLLASWPRALKHGSRVHLHTGTAEVVGRVLLLEGDELAPGRDALIQFKAEAPLVVGWGDRYIIRAYSPVHTMGGGTVIEPHAQFRRFSREALARLRAKETGGRTAVIAETLLRAGPAPLSLGDLAKETGMIAQTLAEELAELAAAGEVRALEGGYYIHRRGWHSFIKLVHEHLAEYFRAQPLRLGMPKEELRRKLLPRGDARGWQALLAAAVQAGELVVAREEVQLPGRTVELTPAQQRLAAVMVAAAEAAGFNPLSVRELAAAAGEDAQAEQMVAYLSETGALVRLRDDLALHRRWLDEAKERTRAFLRDKGKMTVAEFRDLLGTTRKYALPLLEHFDEQRLTRRMGDERYPGADLRGDG